MTAGRFWRKLRTRSSARLASSCVGDPTELTGDVFSDLGREEVGEEIISSEADKTGEQLFGVFGSEVVLESRTRMLVRLVKEAVAFLRLRIKQVVLLLKFLQPGGIGEFGPTFAVARASTARGWAYSLILELFRGSPLIRSFFVLVGRGPFGVRKFTLGLLCGTLAAIIQV